MKARMALLTVAAAAGLALTSGAASAMPNGLQGALSGATTAGSGAEQVRYVCNEWGRCWWRPNYYGSYGYYGGPRYYGYYGGPRYYGGGWGGGWRHRGWGHRW